MSLKFQPLANEYFEIMMILKNMRTVKSNLSYQSHILDFLSNVRLVGFLSARNLDSKVWSLVFHTLIEVGHCRGKPLATSLQSAFVAFLNNSDTPLTSHSEIPESQEFGPKNYGHWRGKTLSRSVKLL
jgi:hypothetical protein